MEQRHAGSGDNVAGNKTTINNVSIPKIIGFTLLGVSLFVVAYLLWPEPVYLAGYVYSSGGQPVEGASLTVRTEEGREYQSVSNGEGFFRFDQLNIKRAGEGRLTVQADVRELALALDTVDLTENGLRLRLPAGTPPFRITYFNLGAHAIDRVLQGKLKKELGGALAEDAYVINNSVGDYYQQLLNDHGAALDEYYYINRPWEEREAATELSFQELYGATDHQSPVLPGKGGTASTDHNMDAELSREQVQRLLRSDSWNQVSALMPDSASFDYIPENSGMVALAWLTKADWDALTREMIAGREAAMEAYLIESRGWEGAYADSPDYRERLRLEYLKEIQSNIAFWDAVIGEDLPSELISARITQGPGCSVASFNVYVDLPELYIQVAVLENTTDATIQLDTFVFRTAEQGPLRAEAEVLEALREAPVEQRRLFPQGLLAPGEKLIIPSYFYARTNQRAYYPLEEARLFGVKQAEFIKDPTRERPPYVFGPAFRIETVLLGPELYAIREFDRDQLVLIDGIEAGSCPYAYSRARADGPWRLEGHLIYGRRKRAWEGSDTLTLHRFDGTLLVREKDPETSFLQQLYVIAESQDGSRRAWLPDYPTLRPSDPGYLIMNQGDSLLLRFPDFAPRAGERYRLVSAGYYLPYRPDVSYSLQAAAERARVGMRRAGTDVSR